MQLPSLRCHEEEKRVKQCDSCQRSRHAPVLAPLQPWEWPQHPWARLHVDYTGTHFSQMFIVTVNARSKVDGNQCVQVSDIHIDHPTSRDSVCHPWTSELLVSDNGSVFTISEFTSFLVQMEFITLPVPPITVLLMDLQKGRFNVQGIH